MSGWDALENGEWVHADTFTDIAGRLIIFSLISSGEVVYRRRWFKRGKWLRKVSP